MNRRGVAFIICYTVIVALTVLGAGFLATSISENNIARRYSESTRALWIAEAGMAQAYQDWLANVNYSGSGGPVNWNSNDTYTVVKSAGVPLVTVTASVPFANGNITKTIQANFVRIPSAFSNILSTGGNLALNYSGLWGSAVINVNGNTKYFGNYSKSSRVTANFNPAQQKTTNLGEVTLDIPDYSGNGVNNEFTDFVAFGRSAVQAYPANEVVYLTPNTGQTTIIYPNRSAYLGKKIVYVEGPAANDGDVAIVFDATWTANEDITVISTGKVTYLQPLDFPGSRLNVIAWEGYSEGSVLLSNHEGVTYTKGNATYSDLLEIGSTTGNIIANGNLTFSESWSLQNLNYSDRVANGDLPPGFSGLTGAAGGAASITDWQEA